MIQTYLPHRYPFLLIDKIIEITPGEKVRTIKNVSINEPFFQGHFPDEPIMPGALIVEAMAQTVSILAHYNQESTLKRYVLAAIDQVRFKHLVMPGDQLHLTAFIQWRRLNVIKCKTTATVQERLVCKADISSVLTSIRKDDFTHSGRR